MTNQEAIAILKQDIYLDKQGMTYSHNAVGIEALEMAIKALEQEQKTGHWIDREVYDSDRWKCSECGRTEQYQENYCPKCGCRMVEPQERSDKE